MDNGCSDRRYIARIQQKRKNMSDMFREAKELVENHTKLRTVYSIGSECVGGCIILFRENGRVLNFFSWSRRPIIMNSVVVGFKVRILMSSRK